MKVKTINVDGKKSIAVDKVMYVNGTFDRSTVNESSRTVEISFASEIPYLRWFGYEIIDMASMDFSRLNNSAILLFNHDWDRYVGVIEKAWIGPDNRGYATVRFDTHAEAEKVFNSVKTGILTGVSFGYEINQAWEVLNPLNDEHDAFRVKVIPFEISFVTVAADPSVGYGRLKEKEHEKKEIVIIINEASPIVVCEEVCEIDVPEIIEECVDFRAEDEKLAIGNEIIHNNVDNEIKKHENKNNIFIITEKNKMERKDIDKKIIETAKQYGATELALDFVGSERSFEDFQSALLEVRNSKPSQATQEVETFEKDGFSLGLAVRQLMNGDVSGSVKEVSREMERKYGGKRAENSILIPFNAIGRKDVTLANASSAGALKPTQLSLTGIEALYNNLVVVKAGAKYMTDLVGDLDIPRFDNVISAQYVGENAAATGSSLDVDLVRLSGKDLTANIDISRRIRMQTPYNIEALCSEQLMQAISHKMDMDALVGTGANNSVLGILNQAGIGSITTGGTLDWQDMLNLEAEVISRNALINKGSYITNSKVLSRMKGTQKANALNFIYENGLANEYEVLTTNGLAEVGTTTKTSPLLFGDFGQLMVGTWGAIELQFNPYANPKTGLHSLTVFVTYDTAVRHPQSFAVATDIITTA